VARALVQNLLDGFLWPHLWVTLSEILLGFIGGSALGIGLGSLVALAPLAQRVLNPYIIASQAMPKTRPRPSLRHLVRFWHHPQGTDRRIDRLLPLIREHVNGSQYRGR
jgi:NitT/TauT family transport system permease protein